jgi:hypothetical protein
MAILKKATALQFRGGTTAENAAFTGLAKEVIIDTDQNNLVIHDGVTPGGHPVHGEAGPLPTAADILAVVQGVIKYGTADPPEGVYADGTIYLKIEE